eukprot:jgi/Psemu1/249756/estExt_Genewise1Plus.C_70182
MNTIATPFAKASLLLFWALTLLTLWSPIVAFQYHRSTLSARHASDGHSRNCPLDAFKVSVDELEKDLTPAERSITGVVRTCGPSVAYVKSILPSSPMNRPGNIQSRRRNRGRGRQQQQRGSEESPKNGLPRGTDLGSGSGFIVAPGYLCTNFHVIEQAYSIRKNVELAEHTFDEVMGNLTGGFISHDLLNITKSLIQRQFQGESIPFGSSSDLLVGQTVVAIGNPFGLQSTVTSGVVSSVNREFRAGSARTPANTPIRNVIQTDAAINPGNSGGPLLNLKGEVVGINTAIITTSGSSAGIGFAVPADQIQPVVKRIINHDRIETGQRPNQGWLGISVVRQEVSIPQSQNGSSSSNTTTSRTMPLAELNNWVGKVERNSPASDAGIKSLVITSNGIVEYGDAIVAVGGNEVANFEQLQTELESRVAGEQVALTVQDAEGKRRVVYVTLSKKPEP